MKQFILKNIVLAAILVLTVISSVFLIFFIWGKSQMIRESMADIENDDQTLESINMSRKPNSVAQSEKMINADTDTLTKKNVQIYRHFGKPYRPALLKFLKNIASPAELQTDLEVDATLVAKPKPKQDADRDDDDEDEDEEENEAEEAAPEEPSAPSAPTDEEKAVFNPAQNLVVLSFDEDTLRAMLAEIYGEIHQDSSDDTFVIPDTIQLENAQLFDRLFDQMIDAPEAVDPARAEDFRSAAAAKFAKAFALFREEIQELTLEDVTNRVAKECFLDALGLPRLMRQRDCKNYIDFLYQKYLNSDLIPGLHGDDKMDYEREILVQDLIYGKNLNRQALPVPEMVIPIIRNFQIKEDLFRKMKDAGIVRLNSMNAGVFYGSPLDSNDSECPILVFTYTLDMTSTLESIDELINALHAAYKTDRVYVIRDIKLKAPYDEVANANYVVAGHIDGPGSVRKNAKDKDKDKDKEETEEKTEEEKKAEAAALAASMTQYELTDPRHPDYGKVLVGEKRDNINCTLVVNYLFYRADNITRQ